MKADNIQLNELEILEQDENRLGARYSLTTTRTSDLCVASLEGTGEITTRRGKITPLSFRLSEKSLDELLLATLHKSMGSLVLSYAKLTDSDPYRTPTTVKTHL